MKKLLLPLLALLAFGGSGFGGYLLHQKIMVAPDGSGGEVPPEEKGEVEGIAGMEGGHGEEPAGDAPSHPTGLLEIDLGTIVTHLPGKFAAKPAVIKVDLSVGPEAATLSQGEMRSLVQEMIATCLEMPLVNTAPDVMAMLEATLPVAAAERAPWLKRVTFRIVNNV